MRRSSNEGVHGVNGSATRFAARNDPPPFIGDRAIYSCDSPFESQWQLATQPFIETTAPGVDRQALDSVPQLRERDDAEKYLVLIDLGEPFDDARVGSRLRPLRDDVRVEQKGHKSVERS